MRQGKVCLAVVGLRFGAQWVPIYQQHPDVAEVVLCERDETRLQEVGDRFQVARRFTDFDALLQAPDIDAVHLLTPVLLHAAQACQALEAGKHCASAVYMGSSADEVQAVVAAQRAAQKNYMLMETMVYSREFLWVKDRYDRGLLGDLTFLRGTYFQDVEGYPEYWRRVPPMHYATHVMAPLLALTRTRVTKVVCFGSGRLSPRLQTSPHSPFRLETALLRLENTEAAAEITRSWFETARPYIESFSVYGTKQSFEWGQLDEDRPALFTLHDETTPHGRPVDCERVVLPDYADRLPELLRPFTHYADNGAHGGSHPHLAHEFVRSMIEGRPPAIDVITAANWTMPGLCAHESALRDGEPILVPAFA